LIIAVISRNRFANGVQSWSLTSPPRSGGGYRLLAIMPTRAVGLGLVGPVLDRVAENPALHVDGGNELEPLCSVAHERCDSLPGVLLSLTWNCAGQTAGQYEACVMAMQAVTYPACQYPDAECDAANEQCPPDVAADANERE